MLHRNVGLARRSQDSNCPAARTNDEKHLSRRGCTCMLILTFRLAFCIVCKRQKRFVICSSHNLTYQNGVVVRARKSGDLEFLP